MLLVGRTFADLLLRWIDADLTTHTNVLGYPTPQTVIRPFVLGRKGWLFSDTVKGAISSANLFSIVETAKANGVEPHAYLSLLFERLPHARSVEDFEALLPWNLKAELAASAGRKNVGA